MPSRCAPGNFQYGLSGTGFLGVVGFTGGFGIAGDQSGNVGVYTEYGGGTGVGVRGSIGQQAMVTNANSIYDLNGPFVTGSVGAGKAFSGSINATFGSNRDGSPIVGGGLTAGGGIGASASMMGTTTNVTPLFNVFGSNRGANGCR